MEDQRRVVANIFEDTRATLNQIKDEYRFKNDDELVRFLCGSFLSDPRREVLLNYLNARK
ncbi:hypothetical protein ACFOQM_06225 [Paenibacillus sp. GCM10012307]|uniref:Uncharacterized protein n=1 Tax=Paenibacillus roseus TaxID=2798579 RepID=A0A934MKC6_9BACL|nr:hypothetical protein [Paenibacillus roseus]MBJ6360895.1 hypothetical protein [Paenibacillus roseus]